MMRFAFALSLLLVGLVGVARAQALASPPLEPIMYLDNGVTTSDTSINLLYRRADGATFVPTKSLAITNRNATGGAGLLFTLNGATTSATPTSNATQTTIAVFPGETVPVDGQYRVLHYRSDAATPTAMRVIMVY